MHPNHEEENKFRRKQGEKIRTYFFVAKFSSCFAPDNDYTQDNIDFFCISTCDSSSFGVVLRRILLSLIHQVFSGEDVCLKRKKGPVIVKGKNSSFSVFHYWHHHVVRRKDIREKTRSTYNYILGIGPGCINRV